jgi:hypothetical protein
MESNTHSTRRLAWQSVGQSDGLAALTAAVDQLAAHDLAGVTDAVRAERVLELRQLLDRLEGHWLAELAAVDARGAAGADQDTQAPSTASWLRNRLHMGAGAASGCVRTARALFRGPLTQTAQAVTAGELSAAHAAVLAAGTHDLPSHTAAEAEPVLVEAARRLDPPRLRQVIAHLRLVADPDADPDRRPRPRSHPGSRPGPVTGPGSGPRPQRGRLPTPPPTSPPRPSPLQALMLEARTATTRTRRKNPRANQAARMACLATGTGRRGRRRRPHSHMPGS